jgi:hypothetical protein
VIKLLSLPACAVLVVASAAAVAQTPPAERDELEPGVNTSAPASAPPGTPAGDEPRSRSTGEPSARTAPTASVPAQTVPADGASAATTNKPAGRSNARDRLDLDATQITGNRELPKVLYIVPWRGAELGDLVGRPVNSLLDEVLEPVDRDVFRRQNRYFEALQPNEAAPAGKPEK